MARFAKHYIKVAPGKMIEIAEGIGADNTEDFNLYTEPCGVVAGFVESYGPDKGYYLRKDLFEMSC
ncbi:MAG: hypothetical protein COB08_010905 [Rhodobacteraceae bacterium]|nr:hypothetical protein [Paracoccaceae bacterium]